MNDLKENELTQIKMRYAKRENSNYDTDAYFYSGLYAKNERDIIYARIIRNLFGNDLSTRKIIEIGAGSGHNLLFFQYLGFQWGNIFANELLESRFNLLKKRILPVSVDLNDEVCIQGNAMDLPFHEEFDIVLQSTVFSSILDKNFREKLAEKMFDMLKPGGIILSYDFTYNNPNNKDVLKLTKKEIKALFPKNKAIYFKRVTLAPPIARKIGHLYNVVNFFCPVLRTHLIAYIKK